VEARARSVAAGHIRVEALLSPEAAADLAYLLQHYPSRVAAIEAALATLVWIKRDSSVASDGG
jgi:hypothetical protein